MSDAGIRLADRTSTRLHSIRHSLDEQFRLARAPFDDAQHRRCRAALLESDGQIVNASD